MESVGYIYKYHGVGTPNKARQPASNYIIISKNEFVFNCLCANYYSSVSLFFNRPVDLSSLSLLDRILVLLSTYFGLQARHTFYATAHPLNMLVNL